MFGSMIRPFALAVKGQRIVSDLRQELHGNDMNNNEKIRHGMEHCINGVARVSESISLTLTGRFEPDPFDRVDYHYYA